MKKRGLWTVYCTYHCTVTDLIGKERADPANRPHMFYFNFFRFKGVVGILSWFPRKYMFNKGTIVMSGRTQVVHPNQRCLLMRKACRTGSVRRTTMDIVRNRWDIRKAGSIDNWQSCKNNAINLRKSLLVNNVWSFVGGKGEWSFSVICFRRLMNNDLEKTR